MKRSPSLLLTALFTSIFLCALSSCEHRRYEIVMSSHDGVIERSLAVTLEGDGNTALPTDEVAALSKLYQKTDANAGGQHVVFKGRFTGRTPNDVGGAGFHTYLDSPMGSVTAYIERFRGSDDILEQMETRAKAADRLVELVSGWLKTHVGTEKDFDKLQAFLDKDARRDLKNVGLYCWISANDLVRVESQSQQQGAGLPPGVQITPGAAPAASQPAAGVQVGAAAAGTQKIVTDASGHVTFNVGPGGAMTGGQAGMKVEPGSGPGSVHATIGGPGQVTVTNGEPASQPATPPAQEATPEKAHVDAFARIHQYLAERGYLLPKAAAGADAKAPRPYEVLGRLFSGGSDEQRNAAIADLTRQVLTEKAGIENKELVKKVASIWTTDANAAEASLRQYLRQTDEYKKTLAAWKADPNKDANSPEPDAIEVLTDLALSCVDFGGVGPDDNDELVVSLFCPAEPIYTNGTPGADPNFVTWTRIIPKAAPAYKRLPVLCYAVWVLPSEEFQAKHLGSVVITGEQLMQYCLWHQGLSAKEAAEWDAMVAKLSPSPKLEAAVKAFQFSTHPTAPVAAPPSATQAAGSFIFSNGRWVRAGQTGPSTEPALTQPGENEASPDFYEKGKSLILEAIQGSPATQPAGAEVK